MVEKRPQHRKTAVSARGSTPVPFVPSSSHRRRHRSTTNEATLPPCSSPANLAATATQRLPTSQAVRRVRETGTSRLIVSTSR